MNNDFFNEAVLSAAQKGNVDELTRALEQGDINYCDSDGSTAVIHAVLNNHVDALRFLVNRGADISRGTKDGDTPLHIACEKNNKEMILILLLNGADWTLKNAAGLKPGDKQDEARSFLQQIASEEKALNVFEEKIKQKLIEIFRDIDTDYSKSINLQKSIKFNKFVEDNVEDQIIEKDAKEFIGSCAIINKQTVNEEEWLFSFAKLQVCDRAAFDKFLEDYDKIVEQKGKLSEN